MALIPPKHCWANQWWIDDWFFVAVWSPAIFSQTRQVDPGPIWAAPEVQSTWKSCSSTWKTVTSTLIWWFPYWSVCGWLSLKIFLGHPARHRMHFRGLASLRFVGLVYNLNCFRATSWTTALFTSWYVFFFNFIRESVCMHGFHWCDTFIPRNPEILCAGIVGH